MCPQVAPPLPPHAKTPLALATGAPRTYANPEVRDSFFGSPNVTLFELIPIGLARHLLLRRGEPRRPCSIKQHFLVPSSETFVQSSWVTEQLRS